jgi:NAD(P)-dependent dehydrogenase (short-subunit alcohol dehydrogenase family)
MSGRLHGKVALTTGAGGGIGRAIAQVLAEQGAISVVVDIDAESAAQTTRSILEAGGQARTELADVRDAAAVEALAKRVLGELGQVDVLVNNVGHHLVPRPFLKGDPARWHDLYAINLHHVLLCTHAFLPRMLERRSGSIINVSSIEGIRGYPGDSVYGAFKAAVVHFTRCLAVELGATGVRVNGIAPDVTESLQVPYSRMVPPDQEHLWPVWVPVGRMGTPRDQAEVVLFLASDESRFVTGHTIPTDGGTGAAGGWFRTRHRPGFTNRPLDP